VEDVSGVTSANGPPPPPVSGARKLDIFAVALVILAIAAIGAKNIQRTAPLELLNVSYDPTRELYKSINLRFADNYETGAGIQVLVKQSHGGSSRQARSGVAVSISLFVPRAARLKVAELVVTEERIVREKLGSDPQCTAVHIHDLEGELFFGSAPELERHLENAVRIAQEQGVRYIVLRLKRLRNPDAVCLERLEHFLRDTRDQGLTILLAGVRPDLLESFRRLRFQNWFPNDQIFSEEDEVDSATLKAVRRAYDLLGRRNTCKHCAADESQVVRRRAAYYLV
jgi:SulP family sulfate permease